MRLPNVLVIATGGTIASTTGGRPNAAAQPRLSGQALLGAVPAARSIANIDVQSLEPIPSCSITWPQVLDIAARIARARIEGYDGVVVVQGTDTLEETSFAWDLLTPRGTPVVVTGAMRHADLPGADGPANLLDAIRLATSPAARDHGVLVTLAGQIHAARTVRKRHTSFVSAFQSPTGPVGEIVEDRIALAPPDHREVLLTPPAAATAVPVVPLVHASMDDHGWWLPAVASAPAAVIEGLGGGALPVDDAIGLRAIADHIPIVLTSRTEAGGTLQHTYGGFAGSETDLLNSGLLPAGDLDGLKARIVLALGLATGQTQARIAENLTVLGTDSHL